jgi:hypothetical protein
MEVNTGDYTHDLPESITVVGAPTQYQTTEKLVVVGTAYSHPIEAVVTERIVNSYFGYEVEGAWTEAHGILYSIGELQFESLGHAIQFAKEHPPEVLPVATVPEKPASSTASATPDEGAQKSGAD